MIQTWTAWYPALSWPASMALGASLVAIIALVRRIWGQSLAGHRWGIVGLRAASIGTVVAILLGPTIVQQFSIATKRPQMIFLFDGSASMKLGGDTTRWQDSLSFVDAATQAAGKNHATDLQSFRFGHRLAPLRQKSNSSGSETIPEPNASDTRAADAIRELSSRLTPADTAGVVLLSDGRVRGSESVEQLAAYMGSRGIPIHVHPVGIADGSGDVAIVSLVTQPSVRKYTENEVQVFIRSFGMAGKSTTVRIIDSDSSVGNELVVASIPITLSGTSQSVTLTYNVADKPRNFRVAIDPIDGELTTRNNQLNIRVAIDRTRVRVLYLEGNVGSQTSFLESLLGGVNSPAQQTTNNAIAMALREDEEIECAMFSCPGGRTAPQRMVDPNTSAYYNFPASRSELFSYDCIILSNVGPDVLEPEQQSMIVQWLEGRGAGLIVVGGDSLTKASWLDSPMAESLPVTLDSIHTAAPRFVNQRVVAKQHAVWKLFNEASANEDAWSKIPKLPMEHRGLKVKPGAEVLARIVDSDDNAASGELSEPTMIAQRFGRGRVLLATPSFGSNAGKLLSTSWGNQGKRVAAKFWRNLVYWVTEGSSIGRRRVTAEPDKRFYRPGDALNLNAIAYDESARRTSDYNLWAMLEPISLEDSSTLSPAIWPEGVRRESGETSTRVVWGEELPFKRNSVELGYSLALNLSEISDSGHTGMRMELTAYESAGDNKDTPSNSGMGHGTQVDSMSLEIYILSDPFEQQNPLPNHDLMERIATVSGGQVLKSPNELAELLRSRVEVKSKPEQTELPAWSQLWLWFLLCSTVSAEWILRRINGLA